METKNVLEAGVVSTEFISRLGYRASTHPRHFYCVRNGEPLELIVHFFENTRAGKVVYYTEARYIPNGKIRHTAIFQFNEQDDHESEHKFRLYELFYNDQIEAQFERENTFHPSPLMNNEKATSWLDWIRVYWNTCYFDNKYQVLGGLTNAQQIIQN